MRPRPLHRTGHRTGRPTGRIATGVVGARLLAGAVLIGAVLLGVGVFGIRLILQSPTAATIAIGGPFALADGGGHVVTDTDFRGRWMLVYFGYTHCPDACPTALADIAGAVDRLPAADQARIAPVFITVDPERDTDAVVGDYAAAFGAEFVGLTGNVAAISAVERAYRVYAAKHPLADGDYAMDHSSIIYVMDPSGRFVAAIGSDTDPAKLADRLKQLGA